MSAPRPSEADVEALYRRLVGYLRHSLPAGQAVADLDALLAARDAEQRLQAEVEAKRALADLRGEIKALTDEWKAHALDADCLDDDGSRCQRCTAARAIRALLIPRDDAAGAGGAG